MRFIHHIFSGPFRVCIALMNLLSASGSVNRSDYWSGDNTPISRERNQSSTKRQKRWRRRRMADEETSQDDTPKT